MADLINPQLNDLVASALADRQFSYQELLNLLQTAALQGLTESEWSDLKSVYLTAQAQFGTDATRQYLQAIYHSVVFGNPANETWWGGDKAEPLGDLHAGSSEQQTELLIDKWFLGLDLPLPTLSEEVQKSKGKSSIIDYQTAEGSLFVDGVSEKDIVQGQALTCYLLSVLGSIAKNKGQFITDNFIDNGNGTYGLRLYANGETLFTTVNLQLPTGKNGKLIYASDDKDRTLDGELWVSLIEKAYAQFNSQVNTQAFSDKEVSLLRIHGAVDVNPLEQTWSRENSYTAIGRSFAQPIKQFTNLNYQYYSSFLADAAFNDGNNSGVLYSAEPATFKQKLIDALNQGAIGWLASYGATTSNSNYKFNLLPGHAFMLLGYDSTTDKFLIRNPWGGAAQVTPYNTEFSLPIEAFWNQNVKAVVALSDANLPTKAFDYDLSLQDAGGVSEGQFLTFEVTRSASGANSTVYLSAIPGSADANDFLSFNKVALNFAKNETKRLVRVDTFADTRNEPNESFSLNLFTSNEAETSTKELAATILNVTPEKSYTYSISARTPSVYEGSTLEFTIQRSASGTASTVYLSTLNGTTTDLDYQGFNKAVLRFESFETQKVVKIPIQNDPLSEAAEAFKLAVYQNIDDTEALASATGTINDQFQTPYQYVMTSSASSAASAVVEEGEVTFTIKRNGTGSASTVYVSTHAATADPTDYIPLQKQAVTFAPGQQKATVTVKVLQDWLLESDEYFSLDLYTTQNDPIYSTYATAYIRGVREEDIIKDAQGNIQDLKTNDKLYNYTLAVDADQAIKGKAGSASSSDGLGSGSTEYELFAVTEGEEITVTITRSDSGSPSTVYLSTADSNTTSGDYVGLNRFRVDFQAYETTKTITIKTTLDNQTEADETFSLNLYRNYNDTNAASFKTLDIQNVESKLEYSLGVVSEVNEGSDLVVTITRSGNLNLASSAYLFGVGTADESDYEEPYFYEVAFKPGETQKTVTLKTYADNLIEDDEYLGLLLFNSYADILDLNVVQYEYEEVTLHDVSQTADYTYSFSELTPVTEGEPIKLTVYRTGSGTSSTVYLSIYGTADALDYNENDWQGKAVVFAADETEKTLTIDTYADNQIEGDEWLWFGLSANYQAFINYEFNAETFVGIQDAVFNTITYSISSTELPITEGDTLTYTITRDKANTASSVFLTTTGSVDSQDYSGLDGFQLDFAVGELSKTVSIATLRDVQAEYDEYIVLLLFENFGALVNQEYSAYQVNILQDAYNLYGDSVVMEGQTATFTLNRSATGFASEAIITPLAGTADSSDFDATPFVVKFAADDAYQPFSIPITDDTLLEDTESFQLSIKFSDGSELSTPVYIEDNDNFNQNLVIQADFNTLYEYPGFPNTVNYTIYGAPNAPVELVVSGSVVSTDYMLSTSWITLDSNGQGQVSLTALADNEAEVPENVYLTAFSNGQQVTDFGVLINDMPNQSQSLVIQADYNTLFEHPYLPNTVTYTLFGTPNAQVELAVSGSVVSTDYMLSTSWITLDSNGQGQVSLTALADNEAEVPENVYLTAFSNGQQVTDFSVIINDMTTQSQGLVIQADYNNLFEFPGFPHAVTYTLFGAPNAQVELSVSGSVDISDYVLSNSLITLDNRGQGSVSLTAVTDNLIEVPENVYLTAFSNGQQVTDFNVIINDTPTTQTVLINTAGSYWDPGAQVNTTFQVMVGSYLYHIENFGVGDQLYFDPAADSLSFFNESPTDGIVVAWLGQNSVYADVALIGLPLSIDQQLKTFSDFQNIYGIDSLVWNQPIV